MTKQRIDKYVSHNYDLLLRVTRGLCCKYNRTYDPELVVTGAYLHVLRHKASIQDEDILQRYMIANIRQEVTLSQSATNKKLSVHGTEPVRQIEHEDVPYNDPYDKAIAAIDEYRNIPDRVKRRVFEVYFDLGKNSVRKMADHFKISRVSAMNLIRDMKQDLKQLESKLLYLDKNNN